MNEITTFRPEARKWSFENMNVRTVTIDGDPWFVAADVCRALGLSKPENAIARLDDDEKQQISREILTTLSKGGQKSSNSGAQTFTIINECGFYNLVMTSRKPEAKRFKKWVTSEVIPEIRRTGGYGRPVLPHDYPSALRALADEILAVE